LPKASTGIRGNEAISDEGLPGGWPSLMADASGATVIRLAIAALQ